MKQTIIDKTGVLAATIIQGLEAEYSRSQDATISYFAKTKRVYRAVGNFGEGTTKYIAIIDNDEDMVPREDADGLELDNGECNDEYFNVDQPTNDVYIIDKTMGTIEIHSKVTTAKAMDVIEQHRECLSQIAYFDFKKRLTEQRICSFCGNPPIDKESIILTMAGAICPSCCKVASTILAKQKEATLIEHPNWLKEAK